jgi:hypothetical protein
MATLPNGTGGYQVGDGNLTEVQINTQGTPATATVTATLTTAQLLNGIILGTPTTTAAAYTLPLATDLDTAVPSAKVNSSLEFVVVNTNGSGSGVITITTNTGWSIGTSGSQGLMTVTTAGTAQAYRAVKTGDGTWALYRIA